MDYTCNNFEMFNIQQTKPESPRIQKGVEIKAENVEILSAKLCKKILQMLPNIRNI